jgi:hypothetical protein
MFYPKNLLLVLMMTSPFLALLPAGASTTSGSGASGSGDEPSGSQKPLEVNGQSRNLNMMLVLRNDKDKIKFVHPRENYRDEIVSGNSSENSVENRSGDQSGKTSPLQPIH